MLDVHVQRQQTLLCGFGASRILMQTPPCLASEPKSFSAWRWPFCQAVDVFCFHEMRMKKQRILAAVLQILLVNRKYSPSTSGVPSSEAAAIQQIPDVCAGGMCRATQRRCMGVSFWTTQEEPCTWRAAVRTGSTYGMLSPAASWIAQDPPWTSGTNPQVIYVSFPDPPCA